MSEVGTLYIVATPIGNLADLSPRALATLTQVDLIAAEDTRHSQGMLKRFAISTPVLSLHQYNETQRINQLLTRLQQGSSIALISDAGTPVISDPGYRLISAAQQQAIHVVPIPGPCALITALSASGLPADSFIFAGFLAAKASQRKKQLTALINETRTVVLYEATHRIAALLNDMLDLFGPQRRIVLARELTKVFETIYSSDLASLITWLHANPDRQRGEFVVLIRGVKVATSHAALQAHRILQLLLTELSPSRAVALTAEITGEQKKCLYQWALQQLKQKT